MVFMGIGCIIVFYVHCYFLKKFFSMKRDYGNDDFYTNCYFQCEKAVITGNMLQPAYVLKIFEKSKASTKMHDKYGHWFYQMRFN